MKIRFSGKAGADAEARGFTIRTDQPDAAGGEGSAPAPFDLFLASIGTCAGLYVRRFLEQRGFALDDAHLVLTTQKDPDRKRLAGIEIRVVLPPGFPDKYRRAVAHAIDLCPVKQHILEAPRFTTVVETITSAASARPPES